MTTPTQTGSAPRVFAYPGDDARLSPAAHRWMAVLPASGTASHLTEAD